MRELLEPLAAGESPFEGRQPPKASRFVRPELVAEVEFREWTQLRDAAAPSYKGLREDADPRDVVREELDAPPAAEEVAGDPSGGLADDAAEAIRRAARARKRGASGSRSSSRAGR